MTTQAPQAPTLSREGILAEIVQMGKEAALDANPQSYSFERRYRAKQHEVEVKTFRAAFRAIRDANDANLFSVAISALRQAAQCNTSRVNRCNLVIAAIEGKLSANWTVRNDKITFVPTKK